MISYPYFVRLLSLMIFVKTVSCSLNYSPLANTGASGSPGFADPNWRVMSIPSGTGFVAGSSAIIMAPLSGAWTSPEPGYQWIGIENSGEISSPEGDYVFQLLFASANLQSVTVKFWVDNRVSTVIVSDGSSGTTLQTKTYELFDEPGNNFTGGFYFIISFFGKTFTNLTVIVHNNYGDGINPVGLMMCIASVTFNPSPSMVPSESPSPTESASPSRGPSLKSSNKPTNNPSSIKPSFTPKSSVPTSSFKPSFTPRSAVPTVSPTRNPITAAPNSVSVQPSVAPRTRSPSRRPTIRPTPPTTRKPTIPSSSPTRKPTIKPTPPTTRKPTIRPSSSSTLKPTSTPRSSVPMVSTSGTTKPITTQNQL